MATGTMQKVTNNSGSNYCKMPDGTLICWGIAKFASTSAGTQRVWIAYPISFTQIPSTTISWNDSENIMNYFDFVWVANPGVDGFNACAKRLSTTETWYARWIAIGRWK